MDTSDFRFATNATENKSFKKEFRGALRVLLIILPNTKWCYCKIFDASRNDADILNQEYAILKDVFSRDDTFLVDKIFGIIQSINIH
jgi:hypothetical protein